MQCVSAHITKISENNTGDQKEFVLKFLQGVSYIRNDLFMHPDQFIRIIKVLWKNPSRRMLFLVRISKKCPLELPPEIAAKEKEILDLRSDGEYDDYDNGNEDAFLSDSD